jgi:fructoselysine-6-P-deglycase FrlB-like protein
MTDPAVKLMEETGLWRDVTEIPDALASTLSSANSGFEDVARLLRRDGVSRVVASGNGAAYYVAHALWLASLDSPASAPQVVALPAGLLASGRFAWREGDLLMAISSSGEFRDVVEVLGNIAPRPYVAITANPSSTVGQGAQALATYTVHNQRAVTHSQVFCGAIVAALSVWAAVTGDGTLARAVEEAPAVAARAIQRASEWIEELASTGLARPSFTATFGSGPVWSAALEAALLLREVARLPAEGSEAREGATSSMYALGPGDLVLSLPVGLHDEQLSEAEEICAGTGARVMRAPSEPSCDDRLAGVATFPAAAGLSTFLAVAAGLAPDEPAWTTAYYSTARQEERRQPDPT